MLFSICLVHMMLFSICLVHMMLLMLISSSRLVQNTMHRRCDDLYRVVNPRSSTFVFVYCKQPQIYLYCTTLWKTSWFSYPTHTSKLYIKTNVCVLQIQTHAQHYLYCMPVSACTRPSLTWWCCRRIHWQHGFLCTVDMRSLVCDHVRCGQTHW